MSAKRLAFIAGGASAVISAVTAVLVTGLDPSGETTKVMLVVAGALQAGLAALAGYLNGGASTGGTV